jgi:hypothetical protein
MRGDCPFELKRLKQLLEETSNGENEPTNE